MTSPASSSVRTEYDREAARYDRRWAAYERRSLGLLRPWLGARPPGRVLDVGCGTAELAASLARWGVAVESYAGVDVSPGMLRAGRGKAGAADFPAALVAGDAGALPFADGAFDTVVTASALHYWEEVGVALGEARRVLREGGRLLVVDWCGEYRSVRWMERWLRLTGRAGAGALTRAELAARLEGARFRVARAERARISAVWGLMAVEAVAV